MADEKKIVTPHELAAQGDPDAQEYLRWVKLKRRKEELRNKLSTTAGVDQKFRDPEFTKAQADYYGSPSDLARRALESTAMAGNVLKAAAKTPEGASESRMGQVIRAMRATTGLPEDAFRENRIEGSDFTDNETLASAIDIGADLVGGAAAAAGTKALAKRIGSAIASKIPHTVGDIKDIPSVARSADDLAEQAAMFKKIEEQQVAEKAFDKANPIISEAPTASVVDPTSTRTGLDSLDIPEITPTVRINQELVDDVIPLPGGKPALALTGRVSTPLTQAERAAREEAEAAFRKRPEFTAVDPEPKSMLEAADISKLEKEIADSDYVKSHDLMERLSGASDSLPTVEERATEILNERLMKSSDPIPVEIFPNRGAKFFGPEAQVKSNYGTKILAPNEPVTAAKMLKGLETYGSSGSSKLSAEQAVKLQQVLKASKKGKK